jgi:L-fuconolactonase
MTDQMGVLKRDYLPEHLEPILKAAGFGGAIAVQARQSIEETEWLLSLAKAHGFIKGVVGWVDLCSQELGDQLRRFGMNPKLVGVRHIVQDEPDDQFMLREDFRRGIGLLREHDLTYDLLVYPRHLPVAEALVRQFPQQPFVLDHLGKPAIRVQELEPWRTDLKALAKCGNVCCKLSGMVTEANWGKWRKEDLVPYLETAMEAFGPQRLMIGSDWPVCTLSGEYGPVTSVVVDYVSGLSDAERQAILGNNCARFYGIGIGQ